MVTQFFVASEDLKHTVQLYCTFKDLEYKHMYKRIDWIEGSGIFEKLPDRPPTVRVKTKRGWHSILVNTMYKAIKEALEVGPPIQTVTSAKVSTTAVADVISPTEEVKTKKTISVESLWDNMEEITPTQLMARVTKYIKGLDYNTKWSTLSFDERMDLIDEYAPQKFDELLQRIRIK